ncbi:uncharacterized protein [Amphiura filiformis]|uniref:uncharacterized protein n=1 Tax=Amphiura filiformis TaxID=82378 RepID=UPI003B21E4DD
MTSTMSAQMMANSMVTTSPSLATTEDQTLSIGHQLSTSLTLNRSMGQQGSSPSDIATTSAISPNGIITFPVTLNGLSTTLPIPVPLPHRPDSIRPTINSTILQYQNVPFTQQCNVIRPKVKQTVFEATVVSKPCLPQNIPPSTTLPANTTSSPILPPVARQQSAVPAHSQATQLSIQTLPTSVLSVTPPESHVPNMPTSAVSVLSAAILPSNTSEYINTAFLPQVTPVNTSSGLDDTASLMNLPTTHNCQIPLPLAPEAILQGTQLNGFSMPLNANLDSSQIPFPGHVNGYAFPLNGTVREAINAATIGGQYNDTYAPLKRAPGRTQLANHISSGMHMGETSFLCDVCNKVFPLQRLLKRHMKCHNASKKYQCAYCSKGFNDTFDLKRHVRTHTGVRPYKCEQCGKSFTQRCSLESHLNKVHGRDSSYSYKERRSKIFVCEECGHTTTNSDKHYDHVKVNHPESNELRRYQDKMQLKRLVMDNSSSSSGDSGGSSPTLSPEHGSNDGFPQHVESGNE